MSWSMELRVTTEQDRDARFVEVRDSQTATTLPVYQDDVERARVLAFELIDADSELLAAPYYTIGASGYRSANNYASICVNVRRES